MGRKNISSEQGYTRTDLLAVVLVIAVLAVTQFAAIANNRQTSLAASCLSNLSQLQRAWMLYAEDNNGWILRATYPAGTGIPEWNGGGWLDFSAHPGNTDPEQNRAKSPLRPYLAKHYQMWRCPADISTAPISGGGQSLRVLSYSMNNWQGGVDWVASGYNWQVRRRLSDFNSPSPVNSWLLMDEHPNSINDGFFPVDMAGFGSDASVYRIIDYPASHHGGGAGVVFADGHTELKRWTDERTVLPFIQSYSYPLNVASPNNADVFWLQERSTRRN